MITVKISTFDVIDLNFYMTYPNRRLLGTYVSLFFDVIIVSPFFTEPLFIYLHVTIHYTMVHQIVRILSTSASNFVSLCLFMILKV